MASQELDLEKILGMFRAGPTPEEQAKASKMALMRTGLGVLAANQPSRYPRSPLGVLAQGGMGGLDAYQNQLRTQMDERKAGGAAALQAFQIKKQMDQANALRDLLSPQTPTAAPPAPPQPAGLSTASANAVGAPWAAMQEQPAPPPPQVAPGGYQPIPVDRLAKAAAGGVNIEPFLKLNAEARPDLNFTDAGNEIIVTDKKTMRQVQRIPKGAAPGSVPFEAGDITPSAYRDFLKDKGRASASQTITNVNTFTPASVEAQKEFMKSTRATYDQLKQAPVALQSIERAKALVPEARGFMGPGGETLLDAAKFLNNRVGMNINTEGVKSAEELRTRIFFNIMDNLKKMDAQPSQQQQQIMQEALGKLGTDPNALPQVLDAFGDVIRGKVELHNKEVQGAIERGVKFPYDPLVTLPSAGGGAGPQKGDVVDGWEFLGGNPGNRMNWRKK